MMKIKQMGARELATKSSEIILHETRSQRSVHFGASGAKSEKEKKVISLNLDQALK